MRISFEYSLCLPLRQGALKINLKKGTTPTIHIKLHLSDADDETRMHEYHLNYFEGQRIVFYSVHADTTPLGQVRSRAATSGINGTFVQICNIYSTFPFVD